MDVFSIEQLSFRYPNEPKETLTDLSFSVREGEFLVLCGETDCGKTTLLRLLKRECAPHGTRQGTLLYRGEAPESFPASHAAAIGFVMQRPEAQIVTDTVWHELAFGLENMGLPVDTIGLRVAEMATYLGIESWFSKKTSALSGGQMQLLNLASALVMQPDVLLLDEPTAQLDPMAAEEFMELLARLHRELGLTVILAEHNLERCLPYADRVLLLEQGKIAFLGEAEEAARQMGVSHPLFAALPAAARAYHLLKGTERCPLTIAEGRAFLREPHGERTDVGEQTASYSRKKASCLRLREVSFAYADDEPLVLSDLDLSVYEGEALAILGGNGSGKSTLLRLLAGVLTAQHGKVERVSAKKLAMLPQNVQTLFCADTAADVLAGAPIACDLPFDLAALAGRHPYDLSGGEQQLLGLAKVLAGKPEILLLDEPTKGVDAVAKRRLAAVVRTLKENGMTIVFATHDLEFAASCADRMALLFDGAIRSEGTRAEFLAGNYFYTTAMRRLCRGICEPLDEADVVGDKKEDEPARNQDGAGPKQATGQDREVGKKMPMRESSPKAINCNAGQIVAQHDAVVQNARKAECAASVRHVLAWLIPLVLFPALLAAGVVVFEEKRYAFVSFAAAILSCMLAALAIERRETAARKLTLLATMTALSVAGRLLFAVLPGFKPVTAMVVITAMYMGKEAGFVCGALTALLSNLYFQQGPWTPFQMFAWGMLGLLAGLLAPLLKRCLPALVGYGIFAGVFFSCLMDVWTVLWYQDSFSTVRYFAALVSALPTTVMYAVSNVLFLLLLAKPIGAKLARIQTKYGIQ